MADGLHDVRRLLAEAAQPSRVAGLTVLTRGSRIGDSSRLLASAEMRSLIEVFGKETPVAIIDAPDLLQSGDGMSIAPLVGGVVMVCAEGTASRNSVQRALNQLHTSGANILGLVYNEGVQT
jgi:Mrp family chromosome partitioning ATPase